MKYDKNIKYLLITYHQPGTVLSHIYETFHFIPITILWRSSHVPPPCPFLKKAQNSNKENSRVFCMPSKLFALCYFSFPWKETISLLSSNSSPVRILRRKSLAWVVHACYKPGCSLSFQSFLSRVFGFVWLPLFRSINRHRRRCWAKGMSKTLSLALRHLESNGLDKYMNGRYVS